MDYEGSYKVRRPRRYYLWILLLIPAATFFFFIFHSSTKEPELLQKEKLSALDFRNESITLEDVLRGKFYAKNFNGSFVDAKTIQYFSTNGDLLTLDLESANSTLIISSQEFSTKLNHHRPFRCDFSPSKKFVLISYDPQKVYRHSVFALYSVLDLETRELIHLTTKPNQKAAEGDLPRRIQLAKWSKTTDSLVFVQANDIYFLKSVKAPVERITYDGNHLLYNGVTDWVYEEEVFSDNQAVWLYDDTNLAYVSFNDSSVDLIQFPVYGEFQYPVIEAIPYPKSGRHNPTATVYIRSNGVNKPIQLPPYIPYEHYIASVQWTSTKNLLIQVLNRYQNNSWTLTCDLNSMCDVIHTQEQSNGWLDLKPLFELDSKNFVAIESTKQAQHSYKHLVQFSTNSVVNVLSRGDFSVEKILSVSDGIIYFISNGQLYKQMGVATSCLTCALKCLSNDVTMNEEGGEYFINVCLNGLKKVPTVSVHGLQTTKSFLLEDNIRLEKMLETIQLPIVKRYSFKTEKNFTVPIKLFLPFDFDEGRKYPLLIDVYGGPGSSKMNDKFTIDWGTSLTSSKNVIYGSIDGRGSGGQSDDFMFEIYKKFGTVEVDDQIRGVEYFLKTLKFIDPKKVAIWGWSYGGFVTVSVMGKETHNLINCGVAVAPVTNWGFYDTIYTERYMGLPLENFAAYNDSDITNYIENFKTKKFLLIHGNADDNVHYQQSMYLSRSLEMGDVLFQQQSYPDENHGLSSVRPHLYHTLENFLFNECF